MVIYDSVLKKKLNFSPKNENEVNIYLCGPTVYDDAHLGHARSSVCFDLLIRVLKANGYKVNFARNYTDIDDKILNKIKQTNQSLEDITNKYINHYEKDMKALNVLEPTFKPKATYYIKQMQDFILSLYEKGFAYKIEDGIYFDTSKDEKYLSLSSRNLDNLQTRLTNEVNKKNESDFVLWKFDDNFYDFSLGKGRPGWHSECVVMIDEIFKNKLDIHAGGIDLLFPHHENEASQCRCEKRYELASYWMHNGFVKIDGEKMSKSLNNSFFVKDMLENFSGELIRFYLLSSHYRSHFNYTLEDLESAKKRLDKFYRLKQRLNLLEFDDFDKNDINLKTNISKDILSALNDDLNTSKALALLDEFIKEANLNLDKNSKDKDYKLQLEQSLKGLSMIFGFGFMSFIDYFQFGVNKEEKDYINKQILLRNEAKKNKDYALADKIRDELASKNILLSDTTNGVIWEKINA